LIHRVIANVSRTDFFSLGLDSVQSGRLVRENCVQLVMALLRVRMEFYVGFFL
jgi:hypothetical protein